MRSLLIDNGKGLMAYRKEKVKIKIKNKYSNTSFTFFENVQCLRLSISLENVENYLDIANLTVPASEW